MIVLLAFAFLAGAGTALSPCVLPVLPALLSAGGVGGRRRPLGVVLGLSITFTVTIVGVAKVVDGVGLGSDPLRGVAIVVLLVFGIVLLLPSVAARIEAPLSRLARFGPRSSGDGFLSGLLVGGALGFVYTPCASPILAAVISVSAASGKTILIALAYALGSAVVLLALTLGGRRKLFDRVASGRPRPAAAARAGHDHDPHGARDRDQPGCQLRSVRRPAHTRRQPHRVARVLEHRDRPPAPDHRSPARSSRRPTGPPRARARRRAVHHGGAGREPGEPARRRTRSCPPSGPRRNSWKPQDWFNTPGDRPLTLASLQGRVVLIDFWTYTCINCIRTLPYLKAWDAAYRNRGLTIVGVETPEFAFEHDASNVSNAIDQFGLHYPVVQDNNMGTWNAYGNEDWPADYLIDAHGQVRYTAVGEGDYSQSETAIRALLAEAGYSVGAMSHPTGVIVPSLKATPETYLGTARAEGWVSPPKAGLHDYGPPASGGLRLNEFAFSGELEHRRTARDRRRRGRHRRGLPGKARLPRAELGR